MDVASAVHMAWSIALWAGLKESEKKETVALGTFTPPFNGPKSQQK
jgi:hypothetical protein